MLGDIFGTSKGSEQERIKIAMELQERELKQAELREQARKQAVAWSEDSERNPAATTPEERRFRDESADIVNAYWGERRRAHQAQGQASGSALGNGQRPKPARLRIQRIG